MYNYNYSLTQPQPHTTSSDLSSILSGATGAVIALVVILGLIALAVVVFYLIAYCKMFTKAGEKWWKGLIPLYNSWVQTRFSGLAWWWFPIFVFLGICVTTQSESEAAFVYSMGLLLVSFNYCFNLAKKFGKSNGFAFLCCILPIIGIPILAFGSAKYSKDAKVDPNGIFSVEK